MNMKLWIVMSFFITSVIDARHISVKNDTHFSEEINKFEFALVCFLQTPHGHKYSQDKELRKDVKMLEHTIDAVADAEPFHKLLKREVGFIVVDASKDSVQSLIKKYKIARNEMPQFLLFNNGKVVTSMSGDHAQLLGYALKADIIDFMDDYFGKSFDAILAQKAEDDQADREMQLARYEAYAAYRYPYGEYAPYNAYGPYSWYGYRQFYQNGGYWGHTFYIP